MKTPDEIKRGLECCKPVWIDNHWKTCDSKCPYIKIAGKECMVQLYEDALAYIQQLERERDAAVADLKSVVASNYYSGKYCKYCKYNEPDGQCHHRCIPYSSEWGWEWRGAQEVE